jgi:hypothetical protein
MRQRFHYLEMAIGQVSSGSHEVVSTWSTTLSTTRKLPCRVGCRISIYGIIDSVFMVVNSLSRGLVGIIHTYHNCCSV